MQSGGFSFGVSSSLHGQQGLADSQPTVPAEVYATVEETSSSTQAASADIGDANAGSAPIAAATSPPGHSSYSANPAAAPAAPAGSAPSAASTWSTTSGSADSALPATAGDPQQAEARTAEATASDSQQAEGVATWQAVQNEGMPQRAT